MSQTPITVTLGRDDTFPLQATNPDGTPRSLSGCNVLFGVKADPYSDALLSIGIGGGVTVTNEASGLFTVLVTGAAKTGKLTTLQPFVYDVLVIDAAGLATTPPGLSGDVIVLASVTTSTGGVTQQQPTAQQTNFFFRPDLTALTGGGSTALDGVDTSTLVYPCIFVLRIGGQRQEWMLRDKVSGEVADDPGAYSTSDLATVQPASNSNLIWERV